MRRGTKFLYFFNTMGAGSPFNHFHIYRRWVDATRDRGVDMDMVGFLPATVYLSNLASVRKHTEEPHITVRITPAGGYVKGAFIVLYLLTRLLFYRRLVIHARKVPAHRHVDFVRRIAGDRVRYVVEVEGDIVAEAAYAREYEGESFFYDHVSVEEAKRRQRAQVERPDHVFTVTEELRTALIKRYDDLDLEGKLTTVATDFPDRIEYSADVRERLRRDLGIHNRLAYTYLGSAAPVWQNVPRTIEVFSLLHDEIDRDWFLLLLVRKPDHDLVKELVDRAGIPDDSYLLKEVSSEEVKPHLFASDVGVMLRDDHPMCRVVYGGKFLDYLSAGLPVLTTPAAKWADALSSDGFAIVLDDMNDDEEILRKFEDFGPFGDSERRAVVEWASKTFDLSPHMDRYVDVIEEFALAE